MYIVITIVDIQEISLIIILMQIMNKILSIEKKITSALHAEGREFEPRQNLVYFFAQQR